MKLATLAYSFLIIISCANNTVKERQAQAVEESPTQHNNEVAEYDEARQDGIERPIEEVTVQEPSTIERGKGVKTDSGDGMVEARHKFADAATSDVSSGTTKMEANQNEETADEVEKTASQTPKVEIEVASTPSHKTWDQLLQKYVDNDGNVAYGSFKKDILELSAYLDLLANNAPTSNWSKNEKLAYYINLYNAATVKLILDNYPTKSIKDIKRPWGRDIVKIGDDLVSLGHIEHKVLRKMNEPRIHFAINCASYSCPKLVNRAFTATEMEGQLKTATKDFINDTTRNQFSANEAKLSEIFKWYKGDFTTNGSLKDYINRYLDEPMTSETKIKYLKYNWNLNERK
ncbi:hypothetical protein MTsPCn5_31430 [Croceitalea sp. MTPC5]|uniref:DUF547 domain-containing protein n=1 Tax=Croceitalea sp. MTPC5 TaxID=3056565 RepID=UPI002B39E572|nr:hypothetical protein MTsPCn5_31430 [Croceitalea sp. MTPC5]